MSYYTTNRSNEQGEGVPVGC